MPRQKLSLMKDIEAYEEMRSSLETDHLGEWVVVYEQELVGIFPSFETAATEAVEKFGRGPYLIREVGEVAISLPASVLYHPVLQHANS